MLTFGRAVKVLVVGALVAAGLTPQAAAQGYPSKNVTVFTAFAAGGVADIVARMVSTKLEGRLNRSFVVENRSGAGGNIAARMVASAPADGYSLLVTTSGLAINMTLTKNRGFEMGDLRPVAIVAIAADVMAVNPNNPAKNLKEFIAGAKEKGFTYGTAGLGISTHISSEHLFNNVAKVKHVLVPFQGGPPAITALLGNHIDAVVLTMPPATPFIRSGALRGIGVASEKRVAAIPDVPTYGEMGYPGIYSASWVGVFAPSRTPDAVVAKLNADINKVTQEPDSLASLAKAGLEPMTMNPAETDIYFKREVERWGKMVQAIGFSN
jgi:tripartite-type tricarboxylate transporter receptor subunit TctC